MDNSTIRGELVGHHSEPGDFTLRNRIRPSFGSPPTFNLNKVFPRISIRLKLAIAFAVVALGPLAVVSILGTRETLARLDSTARYTLAHDLEVAERETVRAQPAAAQPTAAALTNCAPTRSLSASHRRSCTSRTRTTSPSRITREAPNYSV